MGFTVAISLSLRTASELPPFVPDSNVKLVKGKQASTKKRTKDFVGFRDIWILLDAWMLGCLDALYGVPVPAGFDLITL